MNFFVCARKIDELFEDVIPQAGETAGRVQASHQQIYDRSDVVIMSDDEQIVDRVLDQRPCIRRIIDALDFREERVAEHQRFCLVQGRFQGKSRRIPNSGRDLKLLWLATIVPFFQLRWKFSKEAGIVGWRQHP